MRIGRALENELVVSDLQVSRHHAEFHATPDGRFEIRDLGSHNGTYVNGLPLNKSGSEKETFHIEIDLAGSGLAYTVGDSFGIFPANDPALVDAVIKALDAPPDFPIGGRTLREVLTDGVSLSPAPDMLFQLY